MIKDIMNRSITAALLWMLVFLSGGGAVAQQKQQVSIRVPPQNIQFGLQQNIVVGDVPNHIVRVFEVHYMFPTNPPTFNGLKLAEAWQRGIADIADGIGTTSSYFLYLMENGDKFVVRNTTIIQPAVVPRVSGAGIGPIVGGTGKLATIRGFARQLTTFDPMAGIPGDTQLDIEYSMDR
jgi:hypothetical protein